MTTIYNRLKNKAEEMEREGFEVDGVVFDQQAEILRAQAQAEGYDVGDHEALCNSDSAAHLRDRREAIAFASAAGNILPDDV
ncbi:hypothetical protein [Rhizobium sp. BK399]|uniref:hypothetical protein n=1 Tax=Rhizobium sp. BK399 TaxID=2587063 RepID=UPI001622DB07|nr:hypothetical protein [Rhizobium sp. BK399]MBB3543911.1 hypothetical protein [Rhizobium sp. BK399]